LELVSNTKSRTKKFSSDRVEDVEDVIREQRLRWLWHVLRIPETRSSYEAIHWEFSGTEDQVYQENTGSTPSGMICRTRN